MGAIVPGTEKWLRYPSHEMGHTRGVMHYGRSVVNGYPGCYKVPRSDTARLGTIGYALVKEGRSYDYVALVEEGRLYDCVYRVTEKWLRYQSDGG